MLRQLSVLILALSCVLGMAGPSGAAARSAASALAFAAPVSDGGQHESPRTAAALHDDADTTSRVTPATAVQSLAGLTTHPADLTAALLLVLAAFFLGRGRRLRSPHALLLRFSTAPARAPPLLV